MTGRAVTSLMFGVLGFGTLFLEVPTVDVDGLYLLMGVFALIAAVCGKEALRSAQRGLATAGLILGLLTGLAVVAGISQNQDALRYSIDHHSSQR